MKFFEDIKRDGYARFVIELDDRDIRSAVLSQIDCITLKTLSEDGSVSAKIEYLAIMARGVERGVELEVEKTRGARVCDEGQEDGR